MTDVITQILDVKSLQCPMPLLKAKLALNKLHKGQILQVYATDVGSWRDFKSYTEQSKHELLSAQESDGIYCYLIKCG